MNELPVRFLDKPLSNLPNKWNRLFDISTYRGLFK